MDFPSAGEQSQPTGCSSRQKDTPQMEESEEKRGSPSNTMEEVYPEEVAGPQRQRLSNKILGRELIVNRANGSGKLTQKQIAGVAKQNAGSNQEKTYLSLLHGQMKIAQGQLKSLSRPTRPLRQPTLHQRADHPAGGRPTRIGCKNRHGQGPGRRSISRHRLRDEARANLRMRSAPRLGHHLQKLLPEIPEELQVQLPARGPQAAPQEIRNSQQYPESNIHHSFSHKNKRREESPIESSYAVKQWKSSNTLGTQQENYLSIGYTGPSGP